MTGLCFKPLYMCPEIMLTPVPVSRTNVTGESFTRMVSLGVLLTWEV